MGPLSIACVYFCSPWHVGTLRPVKIGGRGVKRPIPWNIRFWSSRTLIFLSLLFWLQARKTTEKARIFLRRRTPKILGKERKNTQKNKEFLAREKSKEFPKSKERKIRERAPPHPPRVCHTRENNPLCQGPISSFPDPPILVFFCDFLAFFVFLVRREFKGQQNRGNRTESL